MKKVLLKSSLILVFANCIVMNSSYARTEDGQLILSVFGIANSSVKEVQSENRDKEIHYGLGVLGEANINGIVGLETGALFVQRQYEYGGSLGTLTQQVNRIHVPVVAKFWPTNFLALGVGPYVAFKVGDVKTALNIGNVDVGQVSTNADDDVEFGLDATVTGVLTLNDKTGLFLEGRYSRPFKEESDVDYESVTVLAGVKIAM